MFRRRRRGMGTWGKEGKRKEKYCLPPQPDSTHYRPSTQLQSKMAASNTQSIVPKERLLQATKKINVKELPGQIPRHILTRIADFYSATSWYKIPNKLLSLEKAPHSKGYIPSHIKQLRSHLNNPGLNQHCNFFFISYE